MVPTTSRFETKTTILLTASSPGQAGVLYNTFANAVTTNQTIQDNREGAPVRLVTLDMGQV